MKEAEIIIENTPLTLGQSLTLRVAIESYASWLRENGLGDDEHGREMTKAYLARLAEIRTLIARGVLREVYHENLR